MATDEGLNSMQTGDGASDTDSAESTQAEETNEASATVEFDFDCIEIDRVSDAQVLPPAGLQAGFRVLDCDGDPIEPLSDDEILVINDEKGDPFGAGLEGGSVSDLAMPTDYGLYTVIALDMSDSIFNSGALDSMLDGAHSFIEQLAEHSAQSPRHKVALAVFGRPAVYEVVVDFTDDLDHLDASIEDLRDSFSRGSTDLYGAYSQSISLVRDQGRERDLAERFVVLLTDGTHEAGDEETLRQRAIELKAAHQDLNLYTIGIDGAYDPEKLAELASTAENFLHVDQAEELADAFAEIAYRMDAVAHSNYTVGICTPISLGEQASFTLEIQVDANSETTADSATVAYPVDQLNGDLAHCDANQNAGVGGTHEGDIQVTITTDNAYGFGYGSESAISHYYGGVENQTAGDIFNCANGPEDYTIPGVIAEQASHLYIVAYADSSVTQGVLGQFRRIGGHDGFGKLVYTGDPRWEVCATGLNYHPGSGGPSVETVEAEIGLCNLGEHGGWRNHEGDDDGALALGEDNASPYTAGRPVAGNEFPVVCGDRMDAAARWMWFNWDPNAISWPHESPFLWPGGDNPDSQFLIFRLPASS